ncbi:MAG: hypothetical protein JWN70_3504 [Planctomycetaceae bacterium]|nr:hypothetical protein [Planctomycetaceae bacterium]
MFGWFRPTCPVDPCAKAWIEQRLDWLGDQFGVDVFSRRALILPEEDFFPDKYDKSPESVRALLDRVCLYMDADPDLVRLELFTDKGNIWLVNDQGKPISRAAGLYEEGGDQTVIHLETSQLEDPMTLVGTIAHELAHLRLLGEQRVDPEIFDNELLTDLTVVFHGLGIFLANVPRAWESDFTHWPGTQIRKPEYMTYPMYGYALAHAAWFRNERKPSWMKYLRLDARSAFKQGLQYLWETRDSRFRPQRAR